MLPSQSVITVCSGYSANAGKDEFSQLDILLSPHQLTQLGMARATLPIGLHVNKRKQELAKLFLSIWAKRPYILATKTKLTEHGVTCLFFENPKAIFIHIPKCGGTSIRQLWDQKATAKSFGHIPNDWEKVPTFTSVRAPESRFMSAVRMFKHGNPDFAGHYNTPVWPDLTVEIALKVLADETVSFDRGQKYRAGNLKHHLIAQTHPYNCLSLAQTIVRIENFDADIAALRKEIDFPSSLDHIRNTTATVPAVPISDAERAQVHDIFAEDYRQLGYAPNSSEMGEMNIKPIESPTIWESWSAFYGGKRFPPGQFFRALPDDDVDLEIFANEIIAGKKGKTWPGRKRDASAHFHELLGEFVGKSRLALLLACCIVIIRRTKGRGPGLVLFHRIMITYTEQICGELNSRWLTSVCDTLADHGQNAAQQSLALCGTVLMNFTKMVETERKVFDFQRPWPPKARIRKTSHLFDGMIPFYTPNGDMVANLLQRINNSIKNDQVAGRVLSEISFRLMDNDTTLRRISEISGQDLLPRLNSEIRYALEMIAAEHF